MRFLAYLFVVVLCGVLIYLVSVVPYAANIEKKRVEQSSKIALRMQSSPKAGILARRNVTALEPYLRKFPVDVELLMLLGLNYLILGRPEEGIKYYARALELEPRPEIYYSLGLAQLRAGRRSSAVESLTRACRFSPVWAEEIKFEDVRIEVIKGCQERTQP